MNLVLGTAQLGTSYGINNSNIVTNEDECVDLLEKAWSYGIRFLDTAEDYGSSESMIGKYHTRNPEQKFNICTKLSGRFDNTQETISERVEASLDRLNAEEIEVYYLHDFELCRNDQIMTALFDLVKRGFVSRIGISIYEPDELRYILDSFGSTVNVVQLPFNVFDSARWTESGLLQRAQKLGIDIFVRSVFLQGILFKNPEDLIVKKLGLSDICRKLGNISKQTNVSVEELALTFVRDIDAVSAVVIGSETPDQIKNNIDLLSSSTNWREADRNQIIELSRSLADYSADPRQWNEVLS